MRVLLHMRAEGYIWKVSAFVTGSFQDLNLHTDTGKSKIQIPVQI